MTTFFNISRISILEYLCLQSKNKILSFSFTIRYLTFLLFLIICTFLLSLQNHGKISIFQNLLYFIPDKRYFMFQYILQYPILFHTTEKDFFCFTMSQSPLSMLLTFFKITHVFMTSNVFISEIKRTLCE